MKRFLLVVLLASLCRIGLFGQTVLTLLKFDGNEYNTEISTRSSISFVSDSVAIFWSGQGDSSIIQCIDDVRMLFFSESIVTGVGVVEPQRVLLYPNPVDDFFIIEGINESCELFIYSMNAVEIMHTKYNNGRQINVSSLKRGKYIVKVGNKIGEFIKN